MNEGPSVLTVILNYRTPELTVKAMEQAVREMEGIRGEIIVVDNGSGDDSCAVIGEAIVRGGWGAEGLVRLMPSGRNGGFGAGNNFGIRQGLSDGSDPDFIYVLNSDAWPEKGAIRALLDVMRTERQTGIVGSYIRGVDGDAHQTAFRFPSIAGEFEGAVRTGIVSRLLADAVVPLPIPEAQSKVDWVAGASAMMRRRMLDEIGLFDETFFLYYEETDLCLRAARAGWDVRYEPRSEVVHIGSVSTGMKTWARTPPYWFASRRHYFTKNHGRFYAARATMARVLGAALWRLRWPLTRRPLGDPPHFLRDLLISSLGAFLPSRRGRAALREQAAGEAK